MKFIPRSQKFKTNSQFYICTVRRRFYHGSLGVKDHEGRERVSHRLTSHCYNPETSIEYFRELWKGVENLTSETPLVYGVTFLRVHRETPPSTPFLDSGDRLSVVIHWSAYSSVEPYHRRSEIVRKSTLTSGPGVDWCWDVSRTRMGR